MKIFRHLSFFGFALVYLAELSAAQVAGSSRSIQSFVDSDPFVEGVAAGSNARLVFETSPGPKGFWTFEEVGSNQYTINNDLTGYTTFTLGAGEIQVLTVPDAPTAWTVTPSDFGPNLYTISAPVPNDQVWWTNHGATNILFVDFTNDIADSIVNRLWRII